LRDDFIEFTFGFVIFLLSFFVFAFPLITFLLSTLDLAFKVFRFDIDLAEPERKGE